MSDKKIHGSMASSMMDAVEHLAKLELEMRQLRWSLCFRDDIVPHVGGAKTHCRQMLDALKAVEYRLIIEHDEKHEQERAIRAVK